MYELVFDGFLFCFSATEFTKPSLEYASTATRNVTERAQVRTPTTVRNARTSKMESTAFGRARTTLITRTDSVSRVTLTALMVARVPKTTSVTTAVSVVTKQSCTTTFLAFVCQRKRRVLMVSLPSVNLFNLPMPELYSKKMIFLNQDSMLNELITTRKVR